MKNIFSRKHDTQSGSSKYKFWIPGSSQERSASRQIPIQTDNTRIHAGIHTPSRAASATNLQPNAAEDKPANSASATPAIYPTTRTYTVPQATFHPSRPSTSRHRDYNDTKYEPTRTRHLPTNAHEREDRVKTFRPVPSRNELAPRNRTELLPPQQSSKQPGPMDDRYREQPFHEDAERRRRDEEKPEARFPRDQYHEENGTIPERRVASKRTRDKDRTRESEPEGVTERDKEKMRQRERERHQREYEKERERHRAERQQREQEREQERERVRLKEQEREKERERERQKELERERELERRKAHEKEKELERERQREERERQRQKEERERERQKEKQKDLERQRESENERERERQKDLEREKLKEEREKERERLKEQERQRELEKEREKERQKELEREKLREEREKEWERLKEQEQQRELEREREKGRQKELEREKERERLKEQERQRELERERERRERLKELEREKERERLKEQERQRELEKERERRERQKELEREKLREERERLKEQERQKQLEREREREHQKELEREKLREERERLKEQERQKQLERERERERQKELEKLKEERERERERLREQRELEKERERQKELEREKLKEERERERERERLKELERQRELERERERGRQKEEQERERERLKEQEWQREVEKERQRERQKGLERERLKEERERVKELERQRESERERDRDRERQKALELERQKEEQEREAERQKELERERLKEEREGESERVKELEWQRDSENERKRERERQELDLEKIKEKERERERQELEWEKQKHIEREREREQQKELERERLKNERERGRQRQKERERGRERQKEMERQIQLEREQEREAQREFEREKAREHEKQKELERLKDLERQKLKELEWERQRMPEQERERDRERREITRSRPRGRERRDKEDREEIEQELVIMPKQSIADLKPKDMNHGGNPSQQDFDKAEGIFKMGLKIVDTVKPVEDGECQKEMAVKQPSQSQELYRQAKVRTEVVDENKDQLRPKTRWDRERRKDSKPGRVSDGQPSPDLRTSRQPRYERPVVDGWGDSSDDSTDGPVPLKVPKHDRTDDEKIPQSRIPASSNQIQSRLNQASTNLLPLYATPRVAPISLASNDNTTDRHILPLASNLVNIGTPHDELARREINRSKLNREDTESLKPTGLSRPPSRSSFVNSIYITPSQKPLAQMKDVQSSTVALPVFVNEFADGRKEMHGKPRSDGLKAPDPPVELPVDTSLDSRLNIVREAATPRFPPRDGKSFKSFPDPPIEQSQEPQLPSMRQMGSVQVRNDTQEGRMDAVTPASTNLTLPTELHPTQTQLGKVARITPPGIRDSVSPSLDERHLDPPLGSNIRHLPTADVPVGTRASSVAPMPTSTLPVPASAPAIPSTIPSVDLRTQVVPSLSPQIIPHPMNDQLSGNSVNHSTTGPTPVRPFPAYGNTAPPHGLSSQQTNLVRPPSPISALPSVLPRPYNREFTPLPVLPSQLSPGTFVDPMSHVHVPPSGADMPVPAQTPFVAVSSVVPDLDRSVATRQDIRQFAVIGSKVDSPRLPMTKDESMIEKRQSTFQVTSQSMVPDTEGLARQRPSNRIEVTKSHLHFPLGVPGDHSYPSISEARDLQRTVRCHVEPTTRTDANNPARVVSQDTTTTRLGTVSVLEKTTDKPSANGRADALLSTGMASLGATPISYMDPETPLVMTTQNQTRDPSDLVRGAFPYVGHDASAQQTLTSAASHSQEVNDREPIDRPCTSSGFRKGDLNNHHGTVPNYKPSESQLLDQTDAAPLQAEVRPPTRTGWNKGHDPRPKGATPEDWLSMSGNAKLNDVSGLGPSSTLPFVGTVLPQNNRQLPGSEALHSVDLTGAPARKIDGSPKLLPQTAAEVRMPNPILLSSDFNTATQPKEVAPLVTETFNKKLDATSLSLTPGIGSNGVTSSNELSGLKKESPLARQLVANASATAHAPHRGNLDGRRKHFNHSPGTQTNNAEHIRLPSETIRVHPGFREPQLANVNHAPQILHATIAPTLESSLGLQVETVPQIKIRHPIIAEDVKRDTEVPQSSKTPIFSGASETPLVDTAATISQKATIPTTTSQTQAVRRKASFSQSPMGQSNDKTQSRYQYHETPETRLLKVDDNPLIASTKIRSDDLGGQAKKRGSPRITAENPALPRVSLKDIDEPGQRKPSSKKESPKKLATTIGDEGASPSSKQDVRVEARVISSRQDNTELRSSKLSTKQLPVVAHQTDQAYAPPSLQPKIQHPVLAELLSSPQTTPVTLASEIPDKGYPKDGNTVHLDSTNRNAHSRLHGAPERHRPELEQKMQLTKEAATVSRPSHRKISSTTFQTVELPPLQEHHVRMTADVVTRVKLARTSDQVVQGLRRHTEIAQQTQPPGSRVMTQESSLNQRVSQIPESQRSTTMSRPTYQSLQSGQGRHQHSASLPTSSTMPEKPVQEFPRSVTPSTSYVKQALAQGRPVMGHVPSEKHVAVPSSASPETVPMTPATPSLTLKQTDPRQSNADSINPQTGKKIRRSRLPSTQAQPLQSYQVWYPGTSSKTPNSSPSQSSGVGIPLEHNTTQLKSTEPNKVEPLPVAKGKDKVAPYNYFTHRIQRSVSRASMEARHGTPPSTVLGSPNASMLSTAPLPPPPSRDTWKATREWISKGEDRVQSQPKGRRPRPGVVFDTDEDAPEDKQRPQRTLTKYRSAAKRHQS